MLRIVQAEIENVEILHQFRVEPIETLVNRGQQLNVLIVRADVLGNHFVVAEIDQQCFGFFGLSETYVVGIVILVEMPSSRLTYECIEGGHRAQMTIDIDIFDPFIGVDRHARRIFLLHDGHEQFVARLAMFEQQIDDRLAEIIGVRRKAFDQRAQFFARLVYQIGRLENGRGQLELLLKDDRDQFDETVLLRHE